MSESTFKVGQIAEYGTPQFENNKSVRTVLETAVQVNPHGIRRNAELYHMTEGFKPAGSCATYVKESYGYTIYWNDGTNHGFIGSYDFIMDKWTSLTLVERHIVAE